MCAQTTLVGVSLLRRYFRDLIQALEYIHLSGVVRAFTGPPSAQTLPAPLSTLSALKRIHVSRILRCRKPESRR